MSSFSKFVGSFFKREKKYLIGNVDILKDGEMKEISFGDQENKKILLSRVKGNYYATGHLCTHYKARLATGVLTEEGRLICPWHAACFNIKTGDIEDAPAVERLKVWPLKIENDQIYLYEEEEEEEQANLFDFKVDGKVTFVIVGGGAAGAMAMESMRLAGFKGAIKLISEEDHWPIDRIKLTKVLDAKVENLLLFRPDYLEKLKVELVSGTVVKLDTGMKFVELKDGKRIPFDKILLATGGEPHKLTKPLPNAPNDRKKVFTIRHIKDNQAIIKAINEMPCSSSSLKLVIVGASFIGMETASMMKKYSNDITIIGMESVPLERVLGKQVGAFMQRLAEKNGIKFLMNNSITLHDDGKGISLMDGTLIEADIVILGIGIKLATDFLKESLTLNGDGSITVDEFMQVSSSPFDFIYAAGDIVKLGGFRIEHWDVALQQGRIAGHNMASNGSKKKAYTSIPFFFSMQFGKSVRYAGIPGYDQIHFHNGSGNEGEEKFIAYYAKDNVVLAVATLGMDPIAVHCSELIRLGKMPRFDDIKKPTFDPLSIKI